MELKESIVKVIKENPGIRVKHIADLVKANRFDLLKAMFELQNEGKIDAVFCKEPAHNEWYPVER